MGGGGEEEFFHAAPADPPACPPQPEPPAFDDVWGADDDVKATALFPFGSHEGALRCDLRFGAGDKITVLNQERDDWWEGQVVGQHQIGIFPAAYVRLD